MYVLRHFEAFFVAAVLLCVAAAFAASSATPAGQAAPAPRQRVAVLVTSHAPPAVIVRGKRLSADEKARASD